MDKETASDNLSIGQIHYMSGMQKPNLAIIEAEVEKMQRDFKSQENVHWYKHKNKKRGFHKKEA